MKKIIKTVKKNEILKGYDNLYKEARKQLEAIEYLIKKAEERGDTNHAKDLRKTEEWLATRALTELDEYCEKSLGELRAELSRG